MVPDVEAAVVERRGNFLSLSEMPDRRETGRDFVSSLPSSHTDMGKSGSNILFFLLLLPTLRGMK